MNRTAVATQEAAAALEAWLRTQQNPDPTRAAIPQAPAPASPPDTRSGPQDQDHVPKDARPTPLLPGAAGPYLAPLRLAHTDWLHHHLTIAGPVPEMAALRAQAAGSGVIPWQLDLDRLEEGWFHLLAAPPAPQERTLSVAGARILAGQLREAVGRRHDLAVAQAARAKGCPFDLHALLPVPDALLRRGPDDPASLAWLWTHWGTTQALRHVTEEPGSRPPHGQATLRLAFWSADWTPWRALDALRERSPALRFDVRPTYDAT